MLVLMLLGLSSLVVLPTIDKGLQDREVRRSAVGLAAVARDLRSRALFEGTAQQLIVDPAQSQYRANRGLDVHLPGDVKFAALEGGEMIDGGMRQFIFFPNGSNHGGSIALSGGRESVSYSVRLEPLTGKIAVLRGDKS
jgi:hypothetical protein